MSHQPIHTQTENASEKGDWLRAEIGVKLAKNGTFTVPVPFLANHRRFGWTVAKRGQAPSGEHVLFNWQVTRAAFGASPLFTTPFQFELPTQRCQTQDQRPKRGAVLICVVACLAVVTLLIGGMLKSTLLTKRQIRTERHLRQAEWLVQAGAERAAFRLASDAEYTGESWSLAADAIVGTDPGVISISVSRESPVRASVRVAAEYPAGRVASIRRSREFLIDPPQN